MFNCYHVKLTSVRLTCHHLHSDITTFFIPGLDVKVHYISKTDDVNVSPESTFQRDLNPAAALRSGLRASSSSKKAVLTTWMTLQSIPEETIITPVILAFLEQASLKLYPNFYLIKW